MDAMKLLEQVKATHEKLVGSVKETDKPSTGREVYVKVRRAEFDSALAHLGGLVTALEVMAAS